MYMKIYIHYVRCIGSNWLQYYRSISKYSVAIDRQREREHKRRVKDKNKERNEIKLSMCVYFEKLLLYRSIVVVQ